MLILFLFYYLWNKLLSAITIQAIETKGLNLSPITLNVLIIPVKPSLHCLIDLNVLPKYVLKQINKTIVVNIL